MPVKPNAIWIAQTKFAAYQNGKLKLEDVAGFAKHKNWGPIGTDALYVIHWVRRKAGNGSRRR